MSLRKIEDITSPNDNSDKQNIILINNPAENSLKNNTFLTNQMMYHENTNKKSPFTGNSFQNNNDEDTMLNNLTDSN